MKKSKFCAACGYDENMSGEYSIHRDGFGIGPEVDLCDICGSNNYTCEQIWSMIKEYSLKENKLKKLSEKLKN